MPSVRLQKYLADAGVASRRSGEKLIAAGSVSVNGRTVKELGTKVTLRVANDYAAVIEGQRNGSIHIAGVMADGADDGDVNPIVIAPGVSFDDLTPIRLP